MIRCRWALAIVLTITLAGCADPVRRLKYGRVIAKEPISLESTFGEPKPGYRYILDDGRRPIAVSTPDQRYNLGDCIAFDNRGLFEPLFVISVPPENCGGAPQQSTTEGVPGAPYGRDPAIDSTTGPPGGPY